MHATDNSDFGFWGNPKFAVALIVAWVAGLILFRAFPQIDLAVAGYFYDAAICSGADAGSRCVAFPASMHPVLAPLREVLHDAPRYVGAALIAYLAYQIVTGLRWHDLALRKVALVIAALLVGPLLIVNGILKEFFGRVRPRSILEFGGSQDFTLPGDLIGQCISNCSFVSGEGSAGGWYLCLGILFASSIRSWAYSTLFIIGFSMALLRVAFGAHFLSDALLGYLLSLIVFSSLVIISERYTTPKH